MTEKHERGGWAGAEREKYGKIKFRICRFHGFDLNNITPEVYNVAAGAAQKTLDCRRNWGLEHNREMQSWPKCGERDRQKQPASAAATERVLSKENNSGGLSL